MLKDVKRTTWNRFRSFSWESQLEIAGFAVWKYSNSEEPFAISQTSAEGNCEKCFSYVQNIFRPKRGSFFAPFFSISSFYILDFVLSHHDHIYKVRCSATFTILFKSNSTKSTLIWTSLYDFNESAGIHNRFGIYHDLVYNDRSQFVKYYFIITTKTYVF